MILNFADDNRYRRENYGNCVGIAREKILQRMIMKKKEKSLKNFQQKNKI